MYAERSSEPAISDPSGSTRRASIASRPLPRIAVRGRSFLALVIAPEPPLDDWFAALDHQLRVAPGFMVGRPVIADLGAMTHPAAQAPAPVLEALDGLAARKLKMVGVEGIDPAELAGTRWASLPEIPNGRDAPREAGRAKPSPASERPAPAARALLIDRALRSGQSVFFEDGDVTIVGTVASGAEVVAGGSIHVYGALRGRAIAGVATGEAARIFCRRLEAELLAIDGLYRTADDIAPALRGKPAQAWLDGEQMIVAGLD